MSLDNNYIPRYKLLNFHLRCLGRRGRKFAVCFAPCNSTGQTLGSGCSHVLTDVTFTLAVRLIKGRLLTWYTLKWLWGGQGQG